MALGVKKLFQHLDAQLHEIRNTLLHKVAGDPGSPTEAQFYYDNTAKRFKYRTNAATKTLAHTDEVSAGATFDDPTASAVGDTMVRGADTDSANAGHRHAREAFGSPAASAVGDSASDGSGTTVPHANHVHAREAFGAVTAQTSFGGSSANGSATTDARSDHAHGTPAHDASAHSAIKLSDLAAPTAQLNIGGQKLTNGANGTADTDFATLGQVNALFEGLSWKDSVRAATTANGTLASAFENGDTIDGVVLATNDRILIKDQTAGENDGIYLVQASGAPVRAPDASTAAEIQGMAVMVDEGTANANTAWYTSTDSITLGTTPIVLSPFPGFSALLAGNGLTKTGNTIDVVDGFGIDVSANEVTIDKALVPIEKSGLVGGAGPTTQYTITNPGFVANTIHSVQIQDVSTGEFEDMVGIQIESDGDVLVDFGIVSVAGTAYRYIMHGLAA